MAQRQHRTLDGQYYFIILAILRESQTKLTSAILFNKRYKKKLTFQNFIHFEFQCFFLSLNEDKKKLFDKFK